MYKLIQMIIIGQEVSDRCTRYCSIWGCMLVSLTKSNGWGIGTLGNCIHATSSIHYRGRSIRVTTRSLQFTTSRVSLEEWYEGSTEAEDSWTMRLTGPAMSQYTLHRLCYRNRSVRRLTIRTVLHCTIQTSTTVTIWYGYISYVLPQWSESLWREWILLIHFHASYSIHPMHGRRKLHRLFSRSMVTMTLTMQC